MGHRISRRTLLKTVGAAGVGAAVAGRLTSAETVVTATPPAQAAADGTILPLTSTSDVFIPPRGRSFQKFSFDFPEPSVVIGPYTVSVLVFTYENTYAMDAARMSVGVNPTGPPGGPPMGPLLVESNGLVWAGGQEKALGKITLELFLTGRYFSHSPITASDVLICSAKVQMDRPIRAVSIVVRGIPRGQVSGGGAPFSNPGDSELLFGYPFSGGDLFGNVVNSGLTTPLVMIQETSGKCFYISSHVIPSEAGRVRTTRIFLQPGENGYRAECLIEAHGWEKTTTFEVSQWEIGRTGSAHDAAQMHYDSIGSQFKIPRWDDRPDVPPWMRNLALAVTLHGQHYTGYIFNNYARQLEILRWIATRIDAKRVTAFLAAWDGRYYWDYPAYQADARMGGEEGFRTLISEGQKLGFAMMPMFGANAANRKRADFTSVADAVTFKPDGDRMDLNWVDWDNDRHQDGWLSYMNLGVDSWRRHMFDRISDVIERYHPDAYFLDIVGGYVNNDKADMHAGTRKLVLDLRAKYPHVAPVGEMHYDAMLEFIPLYHSFGQTEITDIVQQYGRFFQHLSSPAPGRGSSGVHESGFGRWNPQTLGLRDSQIPTLQIVDDTFDKHRDEMDAVIQAAKKRAGM
jgi:hypothetical protein